VLLSSISGGSDVCTAFVGGCPLVPVRAGEISCRYLGARVEAYDEAGRSVVGEQGELVITAPMPSMPVGFWGDEDGARLRAAYYERHPGVWTHGDWITLYPDGASVISGRSDATLNRGGVRMGTAELYAVVEALPEVADSLVVHLEDADGGPGRLVLFVAPAEGSVLDDDLKARIARALRTELSPRHVPDEIHEVPGVPRTLSGKKLEVPVKRILAGAAPDTAASRGSLANPEVLDAYTGLTDSA
jgi:acetoacetyl-CoA synthetase